MNKDGENNKWGGLEGEQTGMVMVRHLTGDEVEQLHAPVWMEALEERTFGRCGVKRTLHP